MVRNKSKLYPTPHHPTPSQTIPPTPQHKPSRKPFLKRRGRSFMYLILPVPVVLLLKAFLDQLSLKYKKKGREKKGRGRDHRISQKKYKKNPLFHPPLLSLLPLPPFLSHTNTFSTWLRGSHKNHKRPFGCGKSEGHTCGTRCGSCCAFYRKIVFP